MKILKNILICLALIGTYACKEATELVTLNLDGGAQGYVAFSETAATMDESVVTTSQDGALYSADGTYTVTVLRSSTDLSSDLTVTFTVSGVFASTTDFADAGDDASDSFTSTADGSIVIPAGKTSASFSLRSVNDLFSSGNKDISLAITNAPGHQIGFEEGGVTGSLSITVVDDDCPIDLTTFEGNWEYVDATGQEGSCCLDSSLNGFGFTNSGGLATLTADATDPTGTKAIFSGGPFGSDYGIQFVTCPGEVVATGTTDSFVGITAWNMQQSAVNGTYTEPAGSIIIIAELGTNGPWALEFKKK